MTRNIKDIKKGCTKVPVWRDKMIKNKLHNDYMAGF